MASIRAKLEILEESITDCNQRLATAHILTRKMASDLAEARAEKRSAEARANVAEIKAAQANARAEAAESALERLRKEAQMDIHNI